jgi:hypothetical protein
MEVSVPYGVAQHDNTVRQRQALELRKAGLAYSGIGEAMGISRNRAYRLVKKALLKIIKEPANEVLTMELSRLDHLLFAVWDKASLGDPIAINSALKIMERRAKLLGLDKGKDAPPVIIDIDGSTHNTQVNIDWVGVIQENPEVLESIKRSLNKTPTGEPGGPDPDGGKGRLRSLPFIRRGGEVEPGTPPDEAL